MCAFVCVPFLFVCHMHVRLVLRARAIATRTRDVDSGPTAASQQPHRRRAGKEECPRELK